MWIFCSKQAHNIIKSTHHKAPCAKFSLFNMPYSQILKLANKPGIHTKNLQLLVIEIFKSLHYLNPEIMWDSFKIISKPCHLQQGISLQIPKGHLAHTIISFDFRAALAWNQLPTNIKSDNTLCKFKASIENCQIYCHCKNCR